MDSTSTRTIPVRGPFWSAPLAAHDSGFSSDSNCWRFAVVRQRHSAGKPAHAQSAGFTLIELLAVMLIAVLLMSLGYAGYNEMRKTTGIGSAARNVADALSLARQTAVTSGRRTRLLISVGGLRGDSHYQYTVVREVPGRRINNQRYWEQIAEWQGLPVGVVFAGTLPPTNSAVFGVTPSISRVYTNALPPVWYTNMNVYGVTPATHNTIEFNREGRPSQTWTVTVARGYYTGSGVSFATSGADYATVILDSQTGKSRVVRQ